MSLRFILGRAGTGKTAYCFAQIQQELIAHPQGPPILLLVPEQATYQMEASLAAFPEINGSMRVKVYSFQRLAWKILQELGGWTQPHLREMGKYMALRQILSHRKDALNVYFRAAKQSNFPETLGKSISELKQYCVTPEMLKTWSEQLTGENRLLGNKLSDLALLYGDLQQFQQERFLDAEDYLGLCAEQLKGSSKSLAAEIWVDGFRGFSVPELRVWEQLCLKCDRMQVLLCLDPAERSKPPHVEDLFYPTRITLEQLQNIGRDNHLEREEDWCLEPDTPPRFQANPALQHLEKQYFSWDQKVYSEEALENVYLAAAHDQRAEVEGVAREIWALVRDQGYRWRDIAIFVRELTPYTHLFEYILTDYQIPYFIDQKRSVKHHPLVELIRSALETQIHSWSPAPIFRFLKTDFTGISRSEVDYLENYVLAHGIRGNRWLDPQPWTYWRFSNDQQAKEFTPEIKAELERINQLRIQAVAPLQVFQEQIQADPSVRGMSTALFNLLTALQVKEQLENWVIEAQEEGELAGSREHAQIYNQILLILDDLVEAVGDNQLNLEEYLQVLETGFASLRLGLIPPGLDQVFVGTLDRSRNPQAKACFLLGVNEGFLPLRNTENDLLTDADRETLFARGWELGPDGQRQLFYEQFLFYQGLTRASTYLWVSFALSDQAGNPLQPSAYFSNLEKLFPRLTRKEVSLEAPKDFQALSYLVHKEQALRYLNQQLRQAASIEDLGPFWRSVYHWLLSKQPLALKKSTLSLYQQNQEQNLQPTTRQQLYRSVLRASISQIEQFRACPFAHFLRYGLNLQERKTAQLKPLDLGQFFHAALQKYVEQVNEQELTWEEITAEDCLRFIGEILEMLLPQLQNEIAMSSKRQQHMVQKLHRILSRTAWVLTQHICAGSFRPVALELGFGFPGGIPAWDIPLKQQIDPDNQDRLELVGRIDRIDQAGGIDSGFLRIIDYKSGAEKISLNEIYHGLRLQLLTYLNVALQHAAALLGQPSQAGGMFYFRIQAPIVQTNGPLDPKEIQLIQAKSSQLKGLMLEDKEVLHLMDQGIPGHSPVIPVKRKADGELASRPDLLTREQFEVLHRYLYRMLQRTGREIMTGAVDIRPYKRKNRKACTYCQFQAVCQFDLLTGNQYQNLVDIPNSAIWQYLTRGGKVES